MTEILLELYTHVIYNDFEYKNKGRVSMKKTSKILSFLLAFTLCFALIGELFSFDAEAASSWVCSWATSIVDSAISVASLNIQDIIPSKSTIRIELKVTTGGEKLRFKFSNEYGSAAISFSEATVAKTQGEGDADIVAGSAKAITFGGQPGVTIQRGETVWSDAVDFPTEALDALSVSIYFENTTYITSAGLSNARTFLGLRSILKEEVSQCYTENIYASREINMSSSTITYHTTPFLAEIDTLVPSGTKSAAVFIGDSTLVNDAYYYYAEKLVKGGFTNVSVVNEAVVANKLLSDGTGLIGKLYGESMLERFERDALNISGVKYIFVKIGLNDILHQFSKSMSADVPHVSVDDIINGYKTLVQKAHAKGIKIYFFTKSAWKGYERAFLGQSGDIVWSKEMQNMCDELDEWIKTNTMADGYIDCSPLKNPADEYALCPSFTPDGAHLTTLGSIALADLIPVSYVGANDDGSMKTSAKIHNVDPYKEKKQIIYDLEHPTEATTEKEEESTTSQKQDEITTLPQEENTTAASPSIEESTESVPEYIAPITVPDLNDKETKPFSGQQVNANYNVSDELPSEIGNGKNVMLMLISFTVLFAAALVVYFTAMRKKDEQELS